MRDPKKKPAPHRKNKGKTEMENLNLIPHRGAEDWEDADIKATAKDNPRLATDLVVRKYRGRLYYHALCILKEPEAAYDAVQEVFIKSIREKRFFEPEFQMKAWLFRVTSNLCFNIVRDRNRRSGLLHVRKEEAMPGPMTPSSSETVQAQQVRNEMMNAMEVLSPNHREILLLRYYDDLSYNEIAAVLQVKLGTVMSRLSRARDRLANVLGPNHPLLTQTS